MPPSPTISGPSLLPSARTLQTHLPDGSPLATLTYHLTPHPFAVLQILHIEVHPSHRRQKHATHLIQAAINDAASLLSPHRLRRIHVGLGHKSHILLRATLTHLGFHHTSTTPGLLKNEDLLTYIKSYT